MTRSLARASSPEECTPVRVRKSVHHSNSRDSVPVTATAHAFETDLFKGQVIVRLPSDPKCATYFADKRRLSSVVITGQFKRDVPFASFVTGQEFADPVKVPNKFLVKALLKVFKVLSPLLRVQIQQSSTYFLSPVAQSAQIIHVSDEPVDLSPDMVVEEDMSRVVELDHVATNSIKRKKFFSKAANLDMYAFDTRHYYTFDFYNDKIDLETFHLNVLSKKFDITPYLLGQPIRVLAKEFSNDSQAHTTKSKDGYGWNFEIFHERQQLLE